MPFHTLALRTVAVLLAGTACRAQAVLPASAPMRFSCGPGAGTHLSPATTYAPQGFGFDLQTLPVSFSGGACASSQPFFFSLAVPEGNYRVHLVLGGPQAGTTTVRAESRRLFVFRQRVAARGSFAEDFVVNVRIPQITAAAGGASQQVKLKPREIGALDWDTKLTLEFNGEHPAFRSLTITPVRDIPTIYLAGDSTVVDQDKEPWAAWGQMLPLFFGPGIAVANHAESGETIKSFVGERRFDKVVSLIRPGDFLMIQFAHNDQKPGTGFVPAATEYKALLGRYILAARSHGATPILVTSMNRRVFDASGHIVQTLGDYPAAMREVAAEQHVALIDLNALSKTLFEAMGDAGTLHAFVHYPANTFPGQPEALKDDTHFNAYGAYELARCVVQSMRDQHLALATYLKDDNVPYLDTFDPAHPDAFASFSLPQSPAISTETPYGR